MGEHDVLVVEAQVSDVGATGATPYVQFAGYADGDLLRGEVSSNAYLAAQYRLDAREAARLRELGWQEPTVDVDEDPGAGSANWFVDLPVADADRLAVISVRALRDVLGVVHPAFLTAEGLVGEADVGPTEPSAQDGEPLAVTVESSEDLRERVRAALRALLGSVPDADEDGDIPVPWGSALVFVRVHDEAPVVELFSIVADGVTDRDRALFEVNVLNRELRFIQFVLVEERVLAQVHLPAWPFVPEHLRSMLAAMARRIDAVDDDLVARVGGRRALEPPPGGSACPRCGGDRRCDACG